MFKDLETQTKANELAIIEIAKILQKRLDSDVDRSHIVAGMVIQKLYGYKVPYKTKVYNAITKPFKYFWELLFDDYEPLGQFLVVTLCIGLLFGTIVYFLPKPFPEKPYRTEISADFKFGTWTGSCFDDKSKICVSNKLKEAFNKDIESLKEDEPLTVATGEGQQLTLTKKGNRIQLVAIKENE